MIDIGTKIADEVGDLIRDARLIELQPLHVNPSEAERVKAVMAQYTDHRVLVLSNCGYRGPGGTYWTANPRKSSDDDLARELAAHHPGDRLVLNGQVYIVPTDA